MAVTDHRRKAKPSRSSHHPPEDTPEARALSAFLKGKENVTPEVVKGAAADLKNVAEEAARGRVESTVTHEGAKGSMPEVVIHDDGVVDELAKDVKDAANTIASGDGVAAVGRVEKIVSDDAEVAKAVDRIRTEVNGPENPYAQGGWDISSYDQEGVYATHRSASGMVVKVRFNEYREITRIERDDGGDLPDGHNELIRLAAQRVVKEITEEEWQEWVQTFFRVDSSQLTKPPRDTSSPQTETTKPLVVSAEQATPNTSRIDQREDSQIRWPVVTNWTYQGDAHRREVKLEGPLADGSGIIRARLKLNAKGGREVTLRKYIDGRAHDFRKQDVEEYNFYRDAVMQAMGSKTGELASDLKVFAHKGITDLAAAVSKGSSEPRSEASESGKDQFSGQRWTLLGKNLEIQLSDGRIVKAVLAAREDGFDIGDVKCWYGKEEIKLSDEEKELAKKSAAADLERRHSNQLMPYYEKRKSTRIDEKLGDGSEEVRAVESGTPKENKFSGRKWVLVGKDLEIKLPDGQIVKAKLVESEDDFGVGDVQCWDGSKELMLSEEEKKYAQESAIADLERRRNADPPLMPYHRVARQSEDFEKTASIDIENWTPIWKLETGDEGDGDKTGGPSELIYKSRGPESLDYSVVAKVNPKTMEIIAIEYKSATIKDESLREEILKKAHNDLTESIEIGSLAVPERQPKKSREPQVSPEVVQAIEEAYGIRKKETAEPEQPLKPELPSAPSPEIPPMQPPEKPPTPEKEPPGPEGRGRLSRQEEEQLRKVAAQTGARVLGSFFGLSTFYDVPAYLSQRWQVRGFTQKGGLKGKVQDVLDFVAERRRLQGFAAPELSEEARHKQFREMLHERMRTIEDIIEKNVPVSDRDTLRGEIAKLLWEHRKITEIDKERKEINKQILDRIRAYHERHPSEGAERMTAEIQVALGDQGGDVHGVKERNQEINHVVDTYGTTKVNAMMAARELLNTGCVAAAIYFTSGLSLAGRAARKAAGLGMAATGSRALQVRGIGYTALAPFERRMRLEQQLLNERATAERQVKQQRQTFAYKEAHQLKTSGVAENEAWQRARVEAEKAIKPPADTLRQVEWWRDVIRGGVNETFEELLGLSTKSQAKSSARRAIDRVRAAGLIARTAGVVLPAFGPSRANASSQIDALLDVAEKEGFLRGAYDTFGSIIDRTTFGLFRGEVVSSGSTAAGHVGVEAPSSGGGGSLIEEVASSEQKDVGLLAEALGRGASHDEMCELVNTMLPPEQQMTPADPMFSYLDTLKLSGASNDDIREIFERILGQKTTEAAETSSISHTPPSPEAPSSSGPPTPASRSSRQGGIFGLESEEPTREGSFRYNLGKRPPVPPWSEETSSKQAAGGAEVPATKAPVVDKSGAVSAGVLPDSERKGLPTEMSWLGKVSKGDSILKLLKDAYERNAGNLGYTGDINNAAELRAWAETTSTRQFVADYLWDYGRPAERRIMTRKQPPCGKN